MEPIKLNEDKSACLEKSSNLDNITVLHVDLSSTADSVAEMEYKLRASGTLSTSISAIKENAICVDNPTPKINTNVSSLPSEEQFIRDNEPSVLWYTQEKWSEPKYICPKCNEGGMRKENDVVYTSNPPCYRYQCDKCGYTTWHHF